MFFRLIAEAARFAWQALRENLLRTALSLLGVTVGIFAIVAVFTAVDSLQRDIHKSMDFLGDRVLYIQKWPWLFKPGSPWWKYMSRPYLKERDFDYLQQNITQAEALALSAFRQDRTLEARSQSISGVTLRGVLGQYDRVANVPIVQGRYFGQQEQNGGLSVAIIGSEIAAGLFPGQRPLGKRVKFKGRPYEVIGVMAPEGKTLLGTPSNDLTMIIPLHAFTKVQKVGPGLELVCLAKARPNDEDMATLEGEIRGLMRARHSLRPMQEDDFAINRPSMVGAAIDAIFAIVSLAGGIIGSFSILVGGFGIANIMFVSVRERTNLIGIQKSLGARNSFILWQFLFEAVLLSIAGGALGILFVYGLTLIPQEALRLQMSAGNVTTGLIISGLIGLAAGILPAIQASRLDPVEAIRSK